MIYHYNRTRTTASVLVITLWTLCFLAALAVIVSAGVRQKLLVVQRLESRTALRNAAYAGLQRARARVVHMQKDTVIAPRDGWQTIAGESAPLAVGNARCQVSLEDEQRKLNLNTADDQALTRLFSALGVADARDLAACVVDWRDPDEVTLTPSAGAESNAYLSGKYPYRAKNAPFETLEELALVKGVTSAVFERVRPYVTVYGDGRINFNTAPREVLYAAGVDEATADLIVSVRQGDDEKLGTPDDRAFESLDGMVGSLRQQGRLNETQEAQLRTVFAAIGTFDTAHFTAQATAYRSATDRTAARCVIDRAGTIVFWREQ